ncbi:MAG TPA: twin transmembrane helix small protein [Usitatibacter sp.]|nr:twin transmembrane helix small protein [Usitatibacter sp.]
MKILLLALVAAVVASLFISLYFVYKDKGNSTRAVKWLTVRVVLQGIVIAVLLGGFLFGFITGRLQ